MTIRHVSIPAAAPAHVADVLAELMGGRAFLFPGNIRAAHMAVSGDAIGTMVEVYPDTVAGEPGEGDAPGREGANPNPPAYWPCHLLMETSLDEAGVLAIGAREGWRTRRFGRGKPGAPPVFEVIEMWLENRFLIEWATADMVGDYERAYQFGFLEQAGIPAHARA